MTLQPPATLGGTMTPRVNCPAGTCPPRHLAAAVAGRMMPAVSAAQTGAPDNHPLGGINMTGIMQGSSFFMDKPMDDKLLLSPMMTKNYLLSVLELIFGNQRIR